MNTQNPFSRLTNEQVQQMLARQLWPRYDADKNQFEQCTTNVEQVNFFLNNLQNLARVVSNFNKVQSSPGKFDEKALQLRKSGNEHFKNGKYAAAITFYNQSLAWAKGDEMVSYAYGNRSAALFGLGFYESCLLDIERALKYGYPENLRPKLLSRKEDAEKARTVSKVYEVTEIPQSEKNELIQSARNCIEIQTNEEYGRHIVAAKDIKIGEVLVVEKPFASMLYAKGSDDPFCFCHECLEHCYSVIPCPNCHERLYCSEICKDTAFQNLHKYECLILRYLVQLVGEDYCAQKFLFSFKITLLAMSDENHDDATYRSDRYKEISELKLHTFEDPTEKKFISALLIAKMFILIKEKTEVFKDFEGCEEKFKQLFCLHLRMIDQHCAEILSWYQDDKTYMSIYGMGLYSLRSLFNHSCYPNTFWHSCDGSTMVLRAYSTIKKGQQCFACYGPTFFQENRNERRRLLQKQFKFNCRCIACEKNWPKMAVPAIDGGLKTIPKVKTELVEVIRKLTIVEAIPPTVEILGLREVLDVSYRILDNQKFLRI